MSDFQLAETNYWTNGGFQVLSFQVLWLSDQVHLRQIYDVPNNFLETTPANQFGMVVQRNLVITLSPPCHHDFIFLTQLWNSLLCVSFLRSDPFGPTKQSSFLNSPTQFGSSDWKSTHCSWAKALKAKSSSEIQDSRGLSTRHLQNKIESFKQ